MDDLLENEKDVEVIGWNGVDDPENPFNWATRRKCIITTVCLLATFTTLINGTIITVAHEAINEEFGVSDAAFPHSYWPVTSWALGGAVFSLVVLPLMEDFGVRTGFLSLYFVFMCFLIPQALAQNFATLIVSRFFSGGCVAVLANTAASVISNVWEGDHARSIPMASYITAYLTGSSLGPVVGAVIFENLSWRWISWMQLIWYAVLFPIYCIFLCETRGNIILENRARKLRKTGRRVQVYHEQDQMPLWPRLKQSIQRPIYMLCTEPVVFVCALWSAFSVGTVYLFTQSVEQVFAGLYGWSATQAGYVQAAIVIGEALGWSAAYVSRRVYFASIPRNKEAPGSPIPEARLYMSLVGSVCGVFGGMLVYAWTAYPFLPWIAPAIGLAMVGYGIDVVIIGIADYLFDAYAKYAGSAVAAVVLGENLFAAFLPLAAQSMYTVLGFHWASTVLAAAALLLSFVPILIIACGRTLRRRSPFMKEATIDKTMVM
jgi:MFS family permease